MRAESPGVALKTSIKRSSPAVRQLCSITASHDSDFAVSPQNAPLPTQTCSVCPQKQDYGYTCSIAPPSPYTRLSSSLSVFLQLVADKKPRRAGVRSLRV
uniref:Uncharacterized protein n=1 Tax=Knipowitschia caucasica TaxID=637954 RepID=A0AAV2KCS6_KNICA